MSETKFSVIQNFQFQGKILGALQQHKMESKVLHIVVEKLTKLFVCLQTIVH